MGSTGVAIYLESVKHASEAIQVTQSEHMDYVAVASLLLNLANLVVVHRFKKQHKRELKELRAQRAAESVRKEGPVSSDEEAASDDSGTPLPPPAPHAASLDPGALETNTTQQSLQTALVEEPRPADSVVLMDGRQESLYQSQASKDAVLITLIHLLFDLLLRLSVVFSAVMVKYWKWFEFDYYCSFFVATVMLVTVVPVLAKSFANMRRAAFDFPALVHGATSAELAQLRQNSLVVHEGKKNLLLVEAPEETRKKVAPEAAREFCRKHGLERIIWQLN